MKTNNPKELYNVVNQLLDNNEETLLPSLELANKFSKFFSNKVSKIRASITPSMNLPEGIIPLSEFEPATEDEIRQMSCLLELNVHQ